MDAIIAAYLAQLHTIELTNAAQPEPSYYPALQNFLVAAAEFLGHHNVQAILQPQHEEYGVPDFQVQQEHAILGWVEAKALAGPLRSGTNQLLQYRAALHNLLFTNFLRFRLFIHGDEFGEVTLAANTTDTPTAAAVAGVQELLGNFFQFRPRGSLRRHSP